MTPTPTTPSCWRTDGSTCSSPSTSRSSSAAASRLHGDLAAEDVAQNVMLRLLQEFHRGKNYGETPNRVVVHQVVTWTIADHFADRPTAVPLPDGWDPAANDPNDDALEGHDLRRLFAPLPEGTRRVLEHRYLPGFEFEDIAQQLAPRSSA